MNEKITAGLASDPSKVNPTGASQEDLSEYQKSLEEQIASLEQRYANPNWFKVAAGFLKPQLGGFAASLGSASDALGESVEQQRAAALPIAQMRSQLAQSKILTGQNKTQSDEFEAWRASGKPMDAATYSRIVSLNPDSPVSKAAQKFYEGAKAGLDITAGAAEVGSKYPQLAGSLNDLTMFQMRPDVSPAVIQAKRAEYDKLLEASRPPQMDPAQWNAMGTYEKQAAVDKYGRQQIEAGMGAEAAMQQQASQAPNRLSLLGSIRDLALGVGLGDTKTQDGKTVSGRDQMAALLNYFGGNNPMEVMARAAADGKLGDKLADIDVYARQHALSPESRDHFQKLAKLLAENQVVLRNGAVNPTNQYSALQQAGSPNLGNTQTALVSLVDLMGHGEKHSIDKYRYVLDKKVPYRQLDVDPDYLQKQQEYAVEHRRIATSNPILKTPSWYNPASGSKQSEEPPRSSSSGTPRERPNERTIGGKTYVRQADGSWKLKGE